MRDLSEIRIPRGNVVGIGKFKIPLTREFYYTCPPLHYMIIKELEDNFVSICIDLLIDGYGGNAKEAKKDMIDSVRFFMIKNFEKLSPEDAWDNLFDLIKISDQSIPLWDAYHEYQLALVRRKDISDFSGILRLPQKWIEKRES
jgi:hypothetical protein